MAFIVGYLFIENGLEEDAGLPLVRVIQMEDWELG
jgi:hypothetical protein